MILRKKPVEVEAKHWTGENLEELEEFTGWRFRPVDEADRRDDPKITAEVFDELHSTWVGVKNDQVIIRGVKGEFYPCDYGVMLTTYNVVSTD